jgi:hypothetical protein
MTNTEFFTHLLIRYVLAAGGIGIYPVLAQI